VRIRYWARNWRTLKMRSRKSGERFKPLVCDGDLNGGMDL
jgi:hypothetical protein